MIISITGRYQILDGNLQEFETPSFKQPTGSNYPTSSIVTLVKFQENIANVAEWGQLDNGHWIPTLQNGKVKVSFIAPASPAKISNSIHILKINETGMISVDGLPYE
jgi:hypothetical protein